MKSLSELAIEASETVTGINIVKTSIVSTNQGPCEEFVIEYKGWQNSVSFYHVELQSRTEEWILDDITTQFEKFKAQVDDTLHQGKL